MLAQRYLDAHVVGIDIDEGAVRQATANVLTSPFSTRIRLEQTRVQDMDASYAGCFDAVVSNPPFFIDSLQAPDRQRNVARHTETLTYADLMKAAHRLLNDDGELSVIVPFDYRRRMDDEAIFQGFFPSRVCAVKTTPTKPVRRYLLAYKKQPCPCEQTELVIGDEQYLSLTGDFYL
jgi:tRNA1Val (adenine37-N6)-methyltransferase